MHKVGRTYNILDAIPYWPETGQAQMTCKALLGVTFAAVTFRITRVFSSETGYMAGIICRASSDHERL